MVKKFLDQVYETEGDAATRALYDEWSASYDDEVTEHGYRTPRRLAVAMAKVAADTSAPVLDYGCGTGLSGAALYGAGFTTIDGADPSPGMLAEAKARKFYRDLIPLDLTRPLPFAPDAYSAIAAVGVISTGAGPASLMDTLIALVPTGGILGFSLNDHALEDAEYTDGVQRLKDYGHIARVEEYGDHLPGLNLNSMIYVFEKA
ncbi:methyltransferase family protein [Litoreibacter ponti]|uniref:Methyltransferase family protein n=1 Tax=Litoreibacter ponti TaxID=1510457 RepID=A0A2T6BIC9_9RHOB|nr:methyltransferase domain-containing protein [Litoreibacter ponti]PTX55817.1 methyltransferase family protein [Litoreibacter ponti]